VRTTEGGSCASRKIYAAALGALLVSLADGAAENSATSALTARRTRRIPVGSASRRVRSRLRFRRLELLQLIEFGQDLAAMSRRIDAGVDLGDFSAGIDEESVAGRELCHSQIGERSVN